MPAANSFTAYGSVAKTLHWLTALLILTLFPLGVIANNLPYDTGAELALKAQVFSAHKTLGVLVFFVALVRIGWAHAQPKPGLLNGEHRVEAFAAELMHGLLYLSLVLVPLSGWLHHAAAEGFAPILWPFGQSLPFIPKSPAVAEFFGAWHFVLTKVLMLALLLHVAGALKHAVIDRDGTLRRMWFGRPVDKTPPKVPHSRAPIRAALGLYALALAAASALGLSQPHDSPAAAPALAEVQSDWQVSEGSLSFSVVQMGAPIEGNFADWTAAIRFSEAASDGKHGDVEVTIAIGSLTLGGVTSDALSAEFFDAAGFPTALFRADILPREDAYVASGTLELKGARFPVDLDFTLQLDGDSATMQGTTTLDRRDFGIGPSYQNESTVGFPVTVKVDLTATR